MEALENGELANVGGTRCRTSAQEGEEDTFSGQEEIPAWSTSNPGQRAVPLQGGDAGIKLWVLRQTYRFAAQVFVATVQNSCSQHKSESAGVGGVDGDKDDSWSTRRRVVETLVAGIEVETLLVEENKRGRGRALTLRVSYRFETPSAEELTPQVQKPYSGRMGHTSANVLGLTLLRTHEALNFAVDQFAGAREAARETLLKEPNLKAKDVIVRVLAETGESISQASVSRMRSRLKAQEAKESEWYERT